MAPAGKLAAVNILAITGALLFSLVEAPFACVRVEVPALPQPSTKNARIGVVLNGEPAGKVRLALRFPGKQARRWLQTDTNGIAMLTDLPEGTTCLLAIGENNLTSSLCLDVPKLATTDKSSFYMALGPAEFSLSPEDKVDIVEHAPPSVSIKSLNGTILDPLGALIVNAEIQVYKRGTYPQDPLVSLKTDERGRFAASLEPGIYTVVFRMRGFKSEILGVEVVRNGHERELRETLQIANDCDW